MDKIIGNKFWEARSSFGEKAVFKAPEEMWAAAMEYFNWCQENPLYEAKLVKEYEEHTLRDIPKIRPFTMQGLWTFLGIVNQTWYNYRKKTEYLGVINLIEQTVRDQKFVGAATGFFNANIIARDLGLVDRVTQEVTNMDNTDLDPVEEMKRRGIPVPELPVDDIPEE